MTSAYLERTLTARVYDVAQESPLELAAGLSRRLQNRVLLKREDQQPIFSFKLRGAYNKIFRLLQSNPGVTGVVAASAGNHAQGVALAATKLGIKATIVMPQTSPSIKVDAVKNLGGKAVLYGDSFDEANEHALKLAQQSSCPFIHPFDDLDTIAGQGTVGMEICRQHPDALHAVFVPIGGGGLMAGVAAYIKHLRPQIKLIGVEPDDAHAMYLSLRAGRRVTLNQVGLFADGVAVKIPGKETYKLCKKYVDEVILVSVDEICAAVKDIFDDTRTMMEPAGALAVAGLKRYVADTEVVDENLIAIASGANVNFDRLRHVSERAEIGEAREVLLAVTIPEQPGSFKRFCRLLGGRSVTEFNYRFGDMAAAQIFVGIQLSGGSTERDALIAQLKQKSYQVLDLTDDELAKLHIRYMVGGRTNGLTNERIFRFEFPERPRALQNFLEKMAPSWNISLFHYRNHGAAFGRVLAGIQVPLEDNKRFKKYLTELDYPYTEETTNPSYRAFLA